MVNPREYYRRGIVVEEIVDFSKGRWVSVEGYRGGRVFARYWRNGLPLTIVSASDLERLLAVYPWTRTIYATLNRYYEINTRESVESLDNIAYTTPFWDIDSSLEYWEKTIEATKLIVDFLEKHGVVESVYLLWSGLGAHVRIHEEAFSPELLEKYHPLDVAYAVVEYVLRELKNKLQALSKETNGVLKIENLVDAKRVFTVPLSLHRRIDKVAVAFKPSEIEEFTPEWANPDKPRHNRDWRKHVVGEADELALKAINALGLPRLAEFHARQTRITYKPGKKEESRGAIGRFQVMGLLQAARYYLLTGDLEKAKSFGLNRAIFYAWAKYYGRTYKPKHSTTRMREDKPWRLEKVLGEEVPVSPRGWFMIGDREQLPEDYDENIASKINAIVPYEKAWKKALEYLKQFPENVLRDPQKFYKLVYEPVRDRFIEKVVEGRFEEKKIRTLDEIFGFRAKEKKKK